MSEDVRVYIGIDPQSDGFSFTVIQRRNGETRYISSDTVNVESSQHADVFVSSLIYNYGPDMVGIEIPGQYGGSGFESSYLISSAMHIGVLAHIFAIHGIRVYYYPAQVSRKNQYGLGWRYYLYGKTKRKLTRKQWDNHIRDHLISGIISDYPSRTNRDVRDSSIIAHALAVAHERKELKLLGCVSPNKYHRYLVRSRGERK